MSKKRLFLLAGIIFLLIFLFFLLIFASLKILKRKAAIKAPEISFFAYSKNFHGDLNLNCGKIGRESKIVVLPKDEKKTRVKIFHKDGEIYGTFFKPMASNFQAAIGDVEGDIKNEIILGQEKGKSNIYIYREQKKNFILSNSFEIFPDFSVGINLALGDVTGDEKKEIIVGAGFSGGPQVKIFDASGRELGSFFAFHPMVRSGVKVAAVNFDGDPKEEIIALTNFERETQFKIYKFDKIYSLQNVTRVYDKNTKILVDLLIADANDDGEKEIIVIPQKKLGKSMAIFKGNKKLPPDILGDYLDPEGGFNVAFCDLDGNKQDDIVVNEKNSLIKIFYR